MHQQLNFPYKKYLHAQKHLQIHFDIQYNF